EHADYLTMRAPRPTLMTVATQDFFDIKGAWTSYKEASDIYKKLGAADKMAIFEYDDKHGWSKPRREASMRWMRKWLVGKEEEQTEPGCTSLKDEELQCTRTGQVLSDLRGVSVFDLNAQRDRELAKERAKFVGLGRKEQEKMVRSDLRLPTRKTKLDFEVTGPVKETPVLIVAFESEPGLKLPFALGEGLAKEGKAKDGVLLIEDEFKGRLADIRGFDFAIHASLRGLGHWAPGKMKAGKGGYFGVDVKEAFLAMHLDRPLLGQRV